MKETSLGFSIQETFALWLPAETLEAHLLYTQVGNRPPQRGWMFSREQTETLQKPIAMHAHRMIFSRIPSRFITSIRKRTVSSATVRAEREQWEKWRDDQVRAEHELRAE